VALHKQHGLLYLELSAQWVMETWGIFFNFCPTVRETPLDLSSFLLLTLFYFLFFTLWFLVHLLVVLVVTVTIMVTVTWCSR
jgi:hypothetical protein